MDGKTCWTGKVLILAGVSLASASAFAFLGLFRQSTQVWDVSGMSAWLGCRRPEKIAQRSRVDADLLDKH